MATPSGQFHFVQHDNIGANAAEEDERFLRDCFVDTGDLGILLDFDNPMCIVGGRTGCGKSALLRELKTRHSDTIEIRPESLSFNYIANSTIIRFFSDLGVNLDPFFKLLWRHVFALEVIQRRFQITNEETKKNWLARFLEPRHEKAKREQAGQRRKRALEYLQRYGDRFWEETEYRTKEIATRFEEELRRASGAKSKTDVGCAALPLQLSGDVSTNRESVKKLSQEERGEWVARGQSVINAVQVKELDDILYLLDEFMEDAYHSYLIVIDRLDDSWVDDSIRLRLIRALIDTVREFRRVRKVKIIIGMRRDLLERVFRMTRTADAGFQEEKFRSLYLPVIWTKPQLVELIDKRIARLVKDRYSKATVTHEDILKQRNLRMTKHGQHPIDFILERTWMRPRDVIEFFNFCIAQARGKSHLTSTMIQTAESEYSRSRFRSLADEWCALYAGLPEFLMFYKKKACTFQLSEIRTAEIDDFCLDYVIHHPDEDSQLATLAKLMVDGLDSHEHFRTTTAYVFYRVGACGLKTESYAEYQWCNEGTIALSPAEITDRALVMVHPALWRVMGIVPK